MRPRVLVAVAGLALGRAPQPNSRHHAGVPQPGQIGLFIANADGGDERPLVSPAESTTTRRGRRTATWIVFTSERNGSADLYRVKPDGSGLERLTDSPAYDDQAAFSPEGKQLVFVTRAPAAPPILWTLDLQTRRAKALTSVPAATSVRRGRPTASGSRSLRIGRATCRSRMAAGSICNSPTSTSFIRMDRD